MGKSFNWRRPSWFSVFVTAIGVYCLSSLGIWQLQRADEKNKIITEIDAQKTSLPEKLTLPINDLDNLRFKKLALQGKFISSRQLLLDNQVLEHQVGYHVLTPFLIEDENVYVLIDRGWISIGQSRDVLPNIDVAEQIRNLVGHAYVPFGEPYNLGTIDNEGSTWPRVIQYLDFQELNQLLDFELLPFTVRLDADQIDGYKATWPSFAFKPERHLAYAVQWFALAITLFIIFIVLHISKNKK